ncbi:hypothetical protein HGRIS_013564 [Hohenbuehelia grisea]|uniref:Uncharacterized protein n=1 Tax=Hohenbuehelia grisea TaxID=104357 RepID=A0ABR3IVV6_9AGAR
MPIDRECIFSPVSQAWAPRLEDSQLSAASSSASTPSKSSASVVEAAEIVRTPRYPSPEDDPERGILFVNEALKLAQLTLNDALPSDKNRDNILVRAIKVNWERREQPQSRKSLANNTSVSDNDEAGTLSSTSTQSIQTVTMTLQCSGWTTFGKQCKRAMKFQVEPLAVLTRIERFCFQHRKRILEPKSFYLPNSNQLVEFQTWVPDYLHLDTQAALRIVMTEQDNKVPDEPGYILIHEIQGMDSEMLRSIISFLTQRDSCRRTIKFKVSRSPTIKVADLSSSRCPAHKHVPRACYPSARNDGGTNVSARSRQPMQSSRRLEKLVHLELTDIALKRPYLNVNWPDVEAQDSSDHLVAGSQYRKCAQCDNAHTDIFEFSRIKDGKYKGNELTIVLGVIHKWGKFIRLDST